MAQEKSPAETAIAQLHSIMAGQEKSYMFMVITIDDNNILVSSSQTCSNCLEDTQDILKAISEHQKWNNFT
jgi:hypothetical protein